MIEIAKRQTGRVAVIVPHGVLFRGGAEGRIRQALIEENLLDAVVGLPANLFTRLAFRWPSCFSTAPASTSM